MTLHQAAQKQIRAANPHMSTWLCANAGSGKTRVLTDRVARLLLEGVSPTRILCLTFTKAAAGEMQNRLFALLGEWAMKPDKALGDTLQQLGITEPPTPQILAKARRLFAGAIETPGGLRIQTIHSFCATLLRRFPLEAGVSPQFRELDERTITLLRADVLDDLAQNYAPDTVNNLAEFYTGDDLTLLAQEIATHADAFTPPLTRDECFDLFKVPLNETNDHIVQDVFEGDEAAWMPEIIEKTAKGSANDQKLSAKLAVFDFNAPNIKLLADLEDVFLASSKSKNPYMAKGESLITNATRPTLTHWPKLDAMMQRVEAARPRRIALHAARRHFALHQFAGAFLALYNRQKMVRGVLDFDDLILYAKNLLTNPLVAQWVLFRLDGGLDHILVDEAQDTSPTQWQVIELLTQEFTAGIGAQDQTRTLFVVGDQKQSIYAFLGADVRAFGAMQTMFSEKLAAIKAPFQRLELEHSFRSSPAILQLVDAVFPNDPHPAFGEKSRHSAFHTDMPGRIDILPVIAAEKEPKDENWSDTTAKTAEQSHQVRLAHVIANQIDAILQTKTVIPAHGGPRLAHAGDFLILMRSRSSLFHALIAACKAKGLPIAGADRLELNAELAVKDITSLLAFLSMPHDDLALAEALRSPLLGLTEAQLYVLARPRTKTLWETLCDRRDHYPNAVDMLDDLRRQADFLRPFDLIDRILTRHNGRHALLARLGHEAEDGMDALLTQSLIYEQNDVPSLTGFLGWLQGGKVEIKRSADQSGQKIRIMTIHGAKGLEAPIVILPDTHIKDRNPQDKNLFPADNAIYWDMGQNNPDMIKAVITDKKARDEDEKQRLLYVALTRAQSWLIIAAAGKVDYAEKNGSDQKTSWYRQICAGALAIGAHYDASGLTCHYGTWPALPDVQAPVLMPPLTPPDWLNDMPPSPLMPAETISPSQLAGAKALPGEDMTDHDGKAMGTWLHLLLEHLPTAPPETWPQLAATLVSDAALRGPLLADAAALLTAPHLAHIFAKPALTEVSLTADFDGKRLLGTIDRLIVEDSRILAIDYKSNRIVPKTAQEVPLGLIRQMQAYRAALMQIYPNKPVETAILWTKTMELMMV